MLDNQDLPGVFWKDKHLWALLFTGGFILLLTVWYGFSMDQAIFTYGAFLFKHYGAPPYLGIWDHNMPGIYIIHGLGLYLFGDSIFAVRLMDFLFQIGNIIMIYYLARRLSGAGTAGFLAGLCYSIYYFGLGMSDSTQREGYILFCILLGLILSLVWKDRVWLRAIFCGLFLGFTFLLKTVMGAVWLVFFAWYLLEGLGQKRKSVWLELALFCAMLALPTAVIAAYYWHVGGLSELYLDNFWYNYAVYAKLKYPARYIQLHFFVVMLPWHLMVDQPLLLIPGCFGVIYGLAGGSRERKLIAALAALMAIFAGLFFLQDKYSRYHLIAFTGLLSIFCGWTFQKLGSAIGAAPGWKASWLRKSFYALTAVILIFQYPAEISYSLDYAFRNPERGYLKGMELPGDKITAQMHYQAARGISRFLQKGDTIGFYGMYPLIPFLLKKPLPSRHCSIQQMVYMPVNGKITINQLRWRQEYIESTIRARPTYFILANTDLGLPTDVPSNNLKDALVQDFPELNAFLQANYSRVANFGLTELYRLNN
jgi:hypothetical protein